ncbi:MAG: gas vesicle protein GvpG [Chloroflexales bacterium]|nr:gas vesicle protein GvpG [Chloroflexales bacterium]
MKLLTLPVTGPIEGVLWLANKLDEQVEHEFYNEPAIRGKLMELELRYDMGEISEEEFLAAEEELLARLKIIRERRAAV